MSRNTRWKLETNKVKVVFRLQFHATHIPQTGWNNLFISLIPSDSGKASAKTNKANVRNGTCKWADPIYETTRLLQDFKTKQYEEKIYKLVVAMGTSRSSLLGEANINLSDYVVASKPIVVTLPLHGSDSGANLHVTVQLLTSKTGFREFEKQREVSDRGLPANTDNVGGKLSSPGEAVVSRLDKVNQRVRFKPENKELASLEEESGFSEGYADSAAGFDESSNNSGSLSAEKPDNSSSREVDSIKSMTSGDLGGVSTSQSPTIVHGTNDWIHQWSDENSVERDMTIVYEENTRLKRALEVADMSIHELKQEVVSLQNFADGLSVETRNLTEKVAFEISSEQNLAKEVSMLKLECVRFKHDLEQVRNLKINPEHSFYHLGEIPAVEGIIPDHATSADNCLGEEVCHPEGVLLPGLLNSGTISVDATNEMQGEIFKLLRELDESKSERENLVQKMGQMECYYEALIQELEVNQKQIIGELQNLRHEHGSCIYTISSTKAQMEVMHQQMNNELLGFAEERRNFDALNNELERRAVVSEAALKRARLNYSIAVNQLQKDLEVLSKQVVSMYETNENLIRNAFSENSLPFLQSCEEVEIPKESQTRDFVLKNHHDEDLCRKMEEELYEMHLRNINLDVFALVLNHCLRESDLNSRNDVHELAEKLECSSKSNELLRVKLQNLSDEICTLNEDNGMFVSRSNDLALDNQTLEAKLRSVSDENCILCEKVRDLESMVNGYMDYKSKYEICDDEKARLANLLEQSDAEKHLLSNDVSQLQEEIMNTKIKVAENENLQQTVNNMLENLENLLANGEKEYKNPDCEKFTSIIMRLEDRLKNFQDEIFQLTEEKTNLVNERDVTRESSEAEIKTIKEEFEHNVVDMASKLNASSALVEKLQVDFESVSNKLKLSSEAEEKCTQMATFILSNFSKMENALEELTLENRNLADMITAFGNVTNELEGNKLVINELKQENLILTESLNSKVNEFEMLTKELDNLKGTVESFQDEITHLRSIRDQLDSQILNLNHQLNERDEKLGQFDDSNKIEIEDLMFSKEELEIRLIVLQATINEMKDELISFGDCKNEKEALHKKCGDLSRKLSEQVLKTEEFKNLSVHLKELNEKAEEDNLQTRKKREVESSSQDSLRIAFIREQYETKLQEIRHQLAISKKHGDELLWKLQDALEEVENRKKCEFSQLKTNEELLSRVTEVEAELQLVISDNREKVMENEQLKAELECAAMSLDCCKEEKNQLIVSLQESNAYKTKLADEVELLKEKLENFKASIKSEENSALSTPRSAGKVSDDQANNLGYRMNSKLDKQDEGEDNQQLAQENLVTETSEEVPDQRYSENDAEHNGDLQKEQLKSQDLLSSIKRLRKELERMRSENTLLPGDENQDELTQEILQRDQVHLEKVSEELENMSSLYNDSTRSGNSVERVLALELELANVLQTKKNPNSQFQSSFLKLHRDEAAIFQSFRDINELIKDMLEMKERHGTMETELRDMHERYSQLSLDFAEVEGERQKLSMMLKNVRPSKSLLSQSPTSSHEDISS